jgi:ribonuclease P protein component
MKTLTLGKSERLKSRKQLDELFRTGRSFSQPPYRVLFAVEPRIDAGTAMLQFGVGASSRHFKRAVDRNLIKRRIREAYRQQRQALETTLQQQGSSMKIFFICTARELPEWDILAEKMGSALIKLEKEIAR